MSTNSKKYLIFTTYLLSKISASEGFYSIGPKNMHGELYFKGKPTWMFQTAKLLDSIISILPVWWDNADNDTCLWGHSIWQSRDKWILRIILQLNPKKVKF